MRQSLVIRCFFSATLTVLFLGPGQLSGQAIQDLVTTLGIQSLATEYLRPGAQAIGSSLNSGLFHTADVDSGFRFWIGLRGMWAYVPESERSFEAVLPQELVDLGYPSRITTATVFGGEGALLHSSRQDPATAPDIQLPGGTDLKQTFLIVPHVTLGSVAACEFMFRGIPPITFDPDIGKVSYYGFGVKHCPTKYIHLPFALSVMGAIQQLKIGTVLEVTNWSLNAHASVPMGFLTLFGGVGYEQYGIDVAYTYTPPENTGLPASLNQPLSIGMSFLGRNLRWTTGVTVSLIPHVDITADYSFGVQDNFTMGAGIYL